MGKCTKGITNLEDKTCGISCYECKEYQHGNKKERQAKEHSEYIKYRDQYISEKYHEHCSECELYVSGAYGSHFNTSSVCRGVGSLGKVIDIVYYDKEINTPPTFCPLRGNKCKNESNI